MAGHTVILDTPLRRDLAHRLIKQAPEGAVMNVRASNRSTAQNAKMWAMLSDVSMAKPEGKRHPPEVWKAIFMNALGYEVRFISGLDGEPFPIGFRTSRLSKAQMADLIEMIYEYGARQGIQWSDEAVPA